MKFYKSNKQSNYIRDIFSNNITAIFQGITGFVYFYKQGVPHNSKNAATYYNKAVYYSYNGENFGQNFTKKTWRSFVKTLIFT